MPVDFQRERSWWNAKAGDEERDLVDEAINRALRWREIERHLEGVREILEIGAGTGAFSIPLARKGYAVTHLDFSPGMLERAREKAEVQGLQTIRFVEQNAVDLSRFADRSFDLVLNMDGAISFSGTAAPRVLAESCRVTRGTLIATVSHRAWMAATFLSAGVQLKGKIDRIVRRMIDHGLWNQRACAECADYARGMTQDYMPVLRAFLPEELRKALEEAGMKVVRLGGLGSLAHLCGSETVRLVLEDFELTNQFLDLCERFDREFLPDGPGTFHRAGLIAVAEPLGPVPD